MATSENVRRRMRFVIRRLYIPVGAALCLGSIAAGGLRLGDFSALIPLGAGLIVAGIAALTIPDKQPDVDLGLEGDSQEDRPDQ